MTRDASPERKPADARTATTFAVRSRFGSFHEMAGAIEDARLGTYILSRESRPWQRTAFRLGECLLQQGVDGAPHVTTGRMEPDRVGFLVVGEDAAPRSCNGQLLDAGSIFGWGAGAEVAVLAREPGAWMAVSASPDALARVAAATDPERAAAPAVPTGLLATSPEETAALRALLGEAAAAFDRAGTAGLPAEAARRLGEDVLRLVARLSAGGRGAPPRKRRPRVDRARVVSRVEELFAATSAEPVYVSTLCEALGIPERTLRLVFVEQYGAGPTHVLRCRRLCQARRALLEAPPEAHVAGIAGRFGFWHLGQFAVDYRRLFGERPSETLRCASSRAGDRARTPGRWPSGVPLVAALATA
ncbi:MAG: helix-turn-helix domain-containing protein [Thermoanaerobaculia bacterium]